MGWGLNLFLLFRGVFIGVVYGVYRKHRAEGRDLLLCMCTLLLLCTTCIACSLLVFKARSLPERIDTTSRPRPTSHLTKIS